ncbi:HesA/MoeB/ThiF family protein [Desulfoluna spongiiphila]|uniref:Molybdopterin or thiamine biosynthesis adenylyltransferase n=1 Tax=Desulfoluna spongiiphila TaxID=419481 RepID=A0A1G5AEA3_9BACT|nr:HesA/MoeB/ThiF family protein [Desulfoluna spongiiphila]SCX76216.1 Molybdopterin or thiamine biosynthesis adenylyltransferase [Desulfoluna spongiiphila]
MNRQIRQAARPNEHGHDMLSETETERIAGGAGLILTDIYNAALEMGIWPERYVRNAGSFSSDEQRQLLGKVVAVAGCGGLGGYIAQFLARMGVGGLRLFDPDVYEASNLNRQVFASSDTLGAGKAETARAALSAVNPSVSVTAHRLDVTGDKARPHLTGVDLVADGLDSLGDRARLSELARALKVPMVHAAISGFEARVMVLWPEGPSFGELFGAEAETTAEATLGTPAVTPAVAAGLQCSQIVGVLLGKVSPAETPMVHMDLMEMRTEVFHF